MDFVVFGGLRMAMHLPPFFFSPKKHFHLNRRFQTDKYSALWLSHWNRRPLTSLRPFVSNPALCHSVALSLNSCWPSSPAQLFVLTLAGLHLFADSRLCPLPLWSSTERTENRENRENVQNEALSGSLCGGPMHMCIE
jgi:hypothetical protein